MYKKLFLSVGIGLLGCVAHSPVTADSLVSFDFDALNGKVYRSKNAKSVERYMESLYGEDISVSKGTVAFKGYLIPPANSPVIDAGQPSNGGGMYLRNSGNKPLILDFGGNGISSFSVDWKLFKNGKGLTILADGVAIDQQTLSNAQRKTGASGNVTFYLDSMVHQLQFVGAKNSRFGIDNLVINLPHLNDGSGSEGNSANGLSNQNNNGSNLPDDSSGNNPPTDNNRFTNEGETGLVETLVPPDGITPSINRLEAVPEPASLGLFALGLCATLWSRRYAAR